MRSFLSRTMTKFSHKFLFLLITLCSYSRASNVLISVPFDNFRIECPQGSGAQRLTIRMVDSQGFKRQDSVFSLSCNRVEEIYAWYDIPKGIQDMEREDCRYTQMFDPVLDSNTEYTCADREYLTGITRISTTKIQMMCCRMRTRDTINCKNVHFNKPKGTDGKTEIQLNGKLINAFSIEQDVYHVRFCDLTPRSISDIFKDTKKPVKKITAKPVTFTAARLTTTQTPTTTTSPPVSHQEFIQVASSFAPVTSATTTAATTTVASLILLKNVEKDSTVVNSLSTTSATPLTPETTTATTTTTTATPVSSTTSRKSIPVAQQILQVSGSSAESESGSDNEEYDITEERFAAESLENQQKLKAAEDDLMMTIKEMMDAREGTKKIVNKVRTSGITQSKQQALAKELLHEIEKENDPIKADELFKQSIEMLTELSDSADVMSTNEFSREITSGDSHGTFEGGHDLLSNEDFAGGEHLEADASPDVFAELGINNFATKDPLTSSSMDDDPFAKLKQALIRGLAKRSNLEDMTTLVKLLSIKHKLDALLEKKNVTTITTTTLKPTLLRSPVKSKEAEAYIDKEQPRTQAPKGIALPSLSNFPPPPARDTVGRYVLPVIENARNTPKVAARQHSIEDEIDDDVTTTTTTTAAPRRTTGTRPTLPPAPVVFIPPSVSANARGNFLNQPYVDEETGESPFEESLKAAAQRKEEDKIEVQSSPFEPHLSVGFPDFESPFNIRRAPSRHGSSRTFLKKHEDLMPNIEDTIIDLMTYLSTEPPRVNAKDGIKTKEMKTAIQMPDMEEMGTMAEDYPDLEDLVPIEDITAPLTTEAPQTTTTTETTTTAATTTTTPETPTTTTVTEVTEEETTIPTTEPAPTTTPYNMSSFFHAPKPPKRRKQKERYLTFCTKEIAIRDSNNMIVACGDDLTEWDPPRCPPGTSCFYTTDSSYRICCSVSNG